MRLIRNIESNRLLVVGWGIYELSEKQQEKFGGKYALSQGLFSNFAVEKIGEDKLLSELKECQYEGIFQTELEAFYQVKLVEMQKKIELLEANIKKLNDASKLDCPEWYKVVMYDGKRVRKWE